MGKRILAYLIDVVIVLLASSMLSSISYLNPQLETYNKYYDEYSEKTKDYLDKKTTDDEYLQITNDYSYKLERNSVYSSVISVVTILLYFGVFHRSFTFIPIVDFFIYLIFVFQIFVHNIEVPQV